MRKFLICGTNIFIIIAALLGSIYFVTVDVDFYMRQYEKNNTTNVTKMSSEDLRGATVTLIDYLKDSRDNLDFQAPVNGEVREIFDQREKDHMIDVKNLFLSLRGALMIFTVLGLIGICLSLYIYKGEGLRALGGNFFKSSIGFLIGIGLLALVFVTNFDWFWTKFHELIFTNDLWLLDPKISIMINMFPLEFFYSCCLRLVGIFVGFTASLSLVGILIKNKLTNKNI